MSYQCEEAGLLRVHKIMLQSRVHRHCEVLPPILLLLWMESPPHRPTNYQTDFPASISFLCCMTMVNLTSTHQPLQLRQRQKTYHNALRRGLQMMPLRRHHRTRLPPSPQHQHQPQQPRQNRRPVLLAVLRRSLRARPNFKLCRLRLPLSTSQLQLVHRWFRQAL